MALRRKDLSAFVGAGQGLATKRPAPRLRMMQNRDPDHLRSISKTPLPSDPRRAIDLEAVADGLARRRRQCSDFPQHGAEQPPCEVTLRQEQPIVAGVLD